MLSPQSVSLLASVGKLASNDINQKPVVLSPNGNTLKAGYYGAYMGGEISVSTDEQFIDEPISIGASQFLELSKLYTDGVVLKRIKEDTLELRAPKGDCRATLQCYASDVPEPLAVASAAYAAKIDGEALRAELALVTPFVSRDSTNPILTGVRLTLDKDVLYLTASDGSTGMIKTSLKCQSEHACEATVTGRDALLAVSLLIEQLDDSDKTIEMAFHTGADGYITKVLFSAGNGYMDCSTLFGKWPDVVDKIAASPVSEASLDLPEVALKRVLTGAKVLIEQPDRKEHSNITFMKLDDMHVRVTTEEGETGSFEVTLMGTMPVDEVTLSSEALERASDLAKQPAMHIPTESGLPVLICGDGDRRYWASRKVPVKR